MKCICFEFVVTLVSDQCKAELEAFKQERATNINKDISLGGPAVPPFRV